MVRNYSYITIHNEPRLFSLSFITSHRTQSEILSTYSTTEFNGSSGSSSLSSDITFAAKQAIVAAPLFNPYPARSEDDLTLKGGSHEWRQLSGPKISLRLAIILFWWRFAFYSNGFIFVSILTQKSTFPRVPARPLPLIPVPLAWFLFFFLITRLIVRGARLARRFGERGIQDLQSTWTTDEKRARVKWTVKSEYHQSIWSSTTYHTTTSSPWRTGRFVQPSRSESKRQVRIFRFHYQRKRGITATLASTRLLKSVSFEA